MNWKEVIYEFLERLASDQSFISKTFFNGDELGFLVDFKGDAGDVHCGGRSVALLTFSGGKKLVYKPKNLELANQYFRLLEYLNPQLSIKLKSRIIAVRGKYTWEEFIDNIECKEKEGFNRFYQRLGMHTRVLQLLGARDFWLDNLIAHGDQPSFIDLEMVIQHVKEEGLDLLPSQVKALDILDETISKIGITSFPIPIGVGEKAEDLGVMAPVRRFKSPFRVDLSSGVNLGVQIDESENGFVVWDKEDYVPKYNGEFANSEDYIEDFILGYKEMNGVLVNTKSQLLSEDSPLCDFSDALLRYIHRDTWTYMRIIKSTSHPQTLVSGLVKDKSLYSLFREVWKDGHLDIHKSSVLKEEILHMQNLDIPLFNTRGGSDALLIQQDELQKYFVGIGLDKILSRLNNIEDFDLEHHVDIIYSSFATGLREHFPMKIKSVQKVDSQKYDWKQYAQECASIISKNMIEGDSEDIAWLGLDFQVHMDNFLLEVLKPDILSGTCGLEMLFVDLFKAFGDEKYKEIAKRSIKSTLEVVEVAKSNFDKLEWLWNASDKPLHMGAYVGVGSQLLSLQYIASQLECKKTKDAYEQYVDSIPVEQIRDYTSSDFISGYSGLLFSLPSITYDNASHLLNYDFTSKVELPKSSNVLTRVPSFSEGAQYYYSSLKGQSDCPDSWNNLFNIGDLFALLEGKQSHAKSEYLKSQMPFGKSLDVLELVEYADLCLCAFDVFDDEEFLLKARAYGRLIIDRYKCTGKWFSDLWVSDRHNLSVLFGIGGLAHLFIRLDNPGEYGSFRRLKTFKTL